MKAVIEVVRSLFFLSASALFGCLLFTGYWLLQRSNWNTTAKGTTNASFSKAYAALGTEAWIRAHTWLLLDIGFVILTLLLGWLWRFCIRGREARKNVTISQ